MSQELKRPDIVRVNREDLKYKGSGKYIGEEYWYQGKPFTGFMVGEYHENGNISYEREYADGQVMGWEMEYHENGKISSEP